MLAPSTMYDVAVAVLSRNWVCRMGEGGAEGIALPEGAGRGGVVRSSRLAGRWPLTLLDDVRRIRLPRGDDSVRFGVRGESGEISAIM